MPWVGLITSLVQLLVSMVGKEEAHRLVSEEAQRQANLMADAVAAGRVASGT